MSYNLLLDTNLDTVYNNSRSGNVTLKNDSNNIGKHWKLTNCYYCDGYLVSSDTIYSIEQEITLTNPTKLYFSMDYIAFNKDIKKIYIGIQCGDTLETTIKKPKFNMIKKLLSKIFALFSLYEYHFLSKDFSKQFTIK